MIAFGYRVLSSAVIIVALTLLVMYSRGPTATPKFLYDVWGERGVSLLILRNTLRDSPTAAGAAERPSAP